MTRVKLGGRELVIDSSEVTEYLAQGYSVIDGKGNELSRGKAITYGQAIKENEELNTRMKKAIKDLESMQTENNKLKLTIKTLTSDLEAANSQYNSLESSVQTKATKSSPRSKSPANEDSGLKKATK